MPPIVATTLFLVFAGVAGSAQAADCRAAIVKLLAEHYGTAPEKIVPGEEFEKLGDDLDFVEIVMASEEEFDIEISDEVAVKFRTVSDLEAYVNANAKKGCR